MKPTVDPMTTDPMTVDPTTTDPALPTPDPQGEELPEMRFRTRRERYLSQGLCASCGRRAPLPNLTNCHACRQRLRKNAARYRARKRKREALREEELRRTGATLPETLGDGIRGAGIRGDGLPQSNNRDNHQVNHQVNHRDKNNKVGIRGSGLAPPGEEGETPVSESPETGILETPTSLAGILSSARPVEVTVADLLASLHLSPIAGGEGTGEGTPNKNQDRNHLGKETGKRGERKDNVSCPVALALRRATRREWTVGSFFATASLGKGTHRQAVLSLPGPVRKFNRILDSLDSTVFTDLPDAGNSPGISPGISQERNPQGDPQERNPQERNQGSPRENPPGIPSSLSRRLPLTFLLRKEDLRERNFYMGQDRFEEDGAQVRKNR